MLLVPTVIQIYLTGQSVRTGRLDLHRDLSMLYVYLIVAI